jgi:hypothetical protein
MPIDDEDIINIEIDDEDIINIEIIEENSIDLVIQESPDINISINDTLEKSWGTILGDIEDQEDLVEYINEHSGSDQIQVDWNQDDNEAIDFIKNKPNIADAQIQSDWNQSDNTKKDFIKNKPSIPDALSDLSEDTTHRVVTDTEKETWNNKSDFSGSYEDLSETPSIPTSLSDLSEDTTHRVVTDTEKETWNNKLSEIPQYIISASKLFLLGNL